MTRPQRPRGRPRVALRSDPDRYAIALLDALIAREGGRRARQCAREVAAMMTGREAVVPVAPHRSGLVQWSLERVRRPGAASSFDVSGQALLNKRRAKCSPDDQHWRRVMAECFRITFDRGAVAPHLRVWVLAGSVGEAAFARTTLWRMIDATGETADIEAARRPRL